MTIKIMAFDWNGTLVNDCEWAFEGVKEIFRHFGKPIPTIEEYREEITNDYMVFYQKRGITASRDVLNDIMNRKVATIDSAALFPDTLSTLRFFKKRGVVLVLVSLREGVALRGDLELYNLTPFFNLIRGDALKKDLFLREAMDLFSADPDEVVFVSDTASDIAAGKLAGVCTVAIPHGFNSRKHLRKAKPDLLVDDLSALVKIFGALL